MGGWTRHFRSFQAGSQVTFDGPTALGLVKRSIRPARVDDYSAGPGEFAAVIRELGIAASVVAPISVGGELWGAVVVSTTGDAPLAADAEARIDEFAELVALGAGERRSPGGGRRLTSSHRRRRRRRATPPRAQSARAMAGG